MTTEKQNFEHFASDGAARTACGEWVDNGTRLKTVSEWTAVTCGACRLEQPLVSHQAPEYRMPSQQHAFLTSLADFSAAQREVASLRSLLEAAETRLSAIVATQKPELSAAATRALLAVPSDAEGAQVTTQTTTSGVRDELGQAGLIGPRGGLTRKGSIMKARLDAAQFDDFFGPE